MYNNKFASAIKVNGKVLREFKDTVYIPFSAEYSILLKNINTVRAIVHVFIDGEDVTGGGLSMRAGEEIDFERSIMNSNLYSGNKFKFIERTGSVENHRGIKLEDGLIRIEFDFEKIYDHIHIDSRQTYAYPLSGYQQSALRGIMNVSGASGAATGIGTTYSSSAVNSISSNAISNATATSYMAQNNIPANDVGITVAGSKSDQQFKIASWYPTEGITHSMIFKILGATADNMPVAAPVTVKAKPRCSSCGRQNKATAKFCIECGTGLVLFA